MPWGRIDDSFYDHPKVLALPDRLRNAGAGVWVRCISWSNRHLADGRIPNAALRSLDCTTSQRDALVAAGLFEEGGDHVRIHDYPEFNETKAEILDRREQAAKAGKLGGLAKKRNRSGPLSGPLSGSLGADGSEPLSEPPTNARGHNAHPGPSPVPVPNPVSSNGLPKPQAVAAKPPAPTPSKKIGGWTSVGEVDFSVTVDQRAHEAWKTFGPEWRAFKRAWIGRGLQYPPKGDPHDDPNAASPSQRALLHSILDARPNDLVHWVSTAPRGSTADVIGHVLREWHALRETVAK